MAGAAQASKLKRLAAWLDCFLSEEVVDLGEHESCNIAGAASLVTL